MTTPFKSTIEGFKYFGIKITPSLNEISTANYDTLVEKVAEMPNRWSTAYIHDRPNKFIKSDNVTKILVLFPNTSIATVRLIL